MIPARHYNSY